MYKRQALNRAKDQVLTQLASAAEGELPSVLVESTYQQEMQNLQPVSYTHLTDEGPAAKVQRSLHQDRRRK